MSKRPDRGSVYWIRIQMQPTPAEQQDMDAKSASFNAYRTHGVASVYLISDADLMNLIRNGIADAMTDKDGENDDIGPQAGQAPVQAMEEAVAGSCRSADGSPNAKREAAR